MKIIFTENAWEDYNSWIKEDKKIRKKINELIKAIQREPYQGIGKPEPLKHELSCYWSRRIDREHRLIYQIDKGDLLIFACKYHYDY
jgi:toxin YoeB